MIHYNPSLENIRMSPIVKISEEVKAQAPEFETKGKRMLYLQRGELDFPTPDYIKQAVIEGLSKNLTRYPTSGGESWFKDVLIEKLKDRNDADGLSRDNIVVTYGGQEALELIFQLFFEKEGAGFSPCWSCVLENFVPYSRIRFHEIPFQPDFSIDYSLLEDMVKRVSFLYVNNPHNPTGKVFSRDELTKIVEICERYGVYIIADEAYERFLYDDLEHVSLLSYPYENILGAFTFSKTYCMTGWRLGYFVSRNKRICSLLRLGDYTQTAGVTTFIQYAGMRAIQEKEKEQEAVSGLLAEMSRRRDFLYSGLRNIPGLEVARPEGAFYMFPNFTAFIPQSMSGKERQRYIYNQLLSVGIACVYGSCFGSHFDDNVRLSFSTTPLSDLEEAVGRMVNLLGRK